jgi:hypothetical protein
MLVGTLPVFDKINISSIPRIYLKELRMPSHLILSIADQFMEINANSDELSDTCRKKNGTTLADYGIKLVYFYVNVVSVPEDDPAVMH